MLSATNLSFSYGNTPVLHNLNLQIALGERVLILGPSGGGKTTLLHLFCGLLQPTEGQLTAPQRLGLVFQENRLLPTLSALENLTLVNQALGESACLALLEEMGIAALAHSLPSALSGGQRRRVAIARALAFDCQGLLLDEPFQGLDSANRHQAAQAILKHLDSRPLLAISHDESDAQLLDAKLVPWASLQPPSSPSAP